MDRNGGSLPIESASRWYAVRVRSRAEKAASANLQAKGIEVFAALKLQRRSWCDRVAEVELPLFPGYVFARFNRKERRIVEDATGVVSIVGAGGKDWPVEDCEIESLQRVAESDGEVWASSTLAPGTRSRVLRGPLKGAEGVVVRRKEGYRLVVSLGILQRSVEVELDEACLEAAC
ncbi:MAG: UpxY family transcription antiterminator [Acidobacteria bacterium]|nr:UpxY family transcription antiterminator [Acidobacteriota bacterium]